MSVISGKRRATDIAARVLLATAVVITLIPLVWIIWSVLHLGIGAIEGLSFFTEPPPGSVALSGGGVANGIIGTLMMVGIAALISIPLGVLGAIYLIEFSQDSVLAKAIRFFAEVMTGIPSIVFGIFVYSVVVVATGGFSAMAGALALALIMWPIALRTTDEVLRLVPSEVREAAYALGIPRWRTILKVVLPTAAGGIATAGMLAIARGAGETAPLLFTALGNQHIALGLGSPMSALPLEIFKGATGAFLAGNERAWAGALTLISLILLLSITARIFAARRMRGA
ncbi:MAG TPA: phosphate ABC transporter permease PstA [Actinomycetota bacterium]|nr:phosphate ABC transporter permease PstA [Actinomycetota bacterium]